jgi:hypothetical protein
MNTRENSVAISGPDLSTESSLRTAAIVAGVSLVVMSVIAIYASLVAQGALVPGDAAGTLQNVMENEAQFRLAAVTFFVIVLLDILVAWGLYVFLKPADENLSLLAAWFRLVYAAVFFAAILEFGNVLRLLQMANILPADQLQAQVLITLNRFSDGWAAGLVIFGMHLALLGYLAYRSGYMPKWLGVLLLIAGFGYLFDAITGLLFPNFGFAIGQFTFIGEVLLGFWLVYKSFSGKQWQKLTLESAAS